MFFVKCLSASIKIYLFVFVQCFTIMRLKNINLFENR